MPTRLILFLSILCTAFQLSSCVSQDQTNIIIFNESPSKVSISWVHIKTKEAVYMSDVAPGGQFSAGSYEGHEFEIREVPADNSGTCNSSQDQTCKVQYVQVHGGEKDEYTINRRLQVVRGINNEPSDQKNATPADVLAKCKKQAADMLKDVEGNSEEEGYILEDMELCIKEGLAPKFIQNQDEVDFQQSVRETLSHRMENFTCLDADMDSSPDVEEKLWTSEKDHVARTVHIKLERPASRIHVIEHFIDGEECAAIEEAAASKLTHASVADGKGGSHVSPHRKAQQASLRPKWHLEAEGDLIARVSRRVYDYANFVLDLDLEEHGQEPLMSIQYFGRGFNDTEPDRYTPHCDGRCDGTPHWYGSRMATMVLYCTVPERGGHTNFQNAGVHVRPVAGNAIFFSYIDPLTNSTDPGLTQHSGCPVFEGEKKIVTQWIRYGVDGNERKHTNFNTLGILISDDGDTHT